MSRKSLVRSLVVVSAALVLALGCQPAAAPQPTPKAGEKAAATTTKPATTPGKPAEKPVRTGTLRVVSPSEPVTLDPHGHTGVPVRWYVHEALFLQDQDLRFTTKEALVKDWTASADGKTVTLKLREGVKFHDGTDFDAAAVKFNLERIVDPATKSPYRSEYASLNSVEVVDGLTVRLVLKQPDPILLDKMGAKGGSMVSPAAVRKYGQDFGRNPVGSGPFQFVEWVPGDRITMKRFEGYWRKDNDGVPLPYLEQVVSKIAPDETVAFANLRTGQADLFTSVPAQQLPALKGDPNLTYTVQRNAVIWGIFLNSKRPPFDNKALRQAVALALDRQGIAALLGEGGNAQASVLHPMTWAYDEKAGQFPGRDLAKAKAKLAEASYAGGLKMKMPTPSSAQSQLIAQIIKANMAEIGIEVEIEVLADAAYQTRVRQEGNYQMTNYSMGVGLADPGYILGLAFHGQGTRNYFGPYSNPQVDELLDKAGSIYDQKERAALYQEAAKILADDAPFVPTHVFNNIHGISKKVRNYVPYLDNDMRPQEVWLAP